MADGPDIVKITVEFEFEAAYQFAQFLKRLTYSDCYEKTETLLPAGEQERRAYMMLYSADRVRKALAQDGVAPS